MRDGRALSVRRCELFVDIAFLSWICSGFSEFFQKNEKKLIFFEKNP